ncbi:MAG TPA: ACT domain-containing protein [Thermoanaerobaculia bacterium]|nr:ACT domain-containing protein [Thermoanaerobaculia bacterium]
MRLRQLAGRYAVCRLDPRDAIPSWADGQGFVSISRTPDELSIICDETRVAATVVAERGWRCLSVEGPIAFSVTGVAASMTGALAAAGISVCLVATYDTDYLLVKEETLSRAIVALRGTGHEVGG